MIGSILGSLKELTIELIFLSLCISGSMVSGFSLFFGGEGDGDFDAHDVGHDGDDHDGHGPGLFSVKGLALLVTGFGAIGFIVQNYTGKVLVASVSGLLFGWVFALIGLTFIRFFVSHQASSHISSEDMIGAQGIITTSIPKNGQGEASLSVLGRQMNLIARTENGTPIEYGARVKVVRTEGGTVTVMRLTENEAA